MVSGVFSSFSISAPRTRDVIDRPTDPFTATTIVRGTKLEIRAHTKDKWVLYIPYTVRGAYGYGYENKYWKHDLDSDATLLDRFRTLVGAAESRFRTLRISNITTLVGDGTKGWPEQAPFDRIIVTAAADALPESLLKQVRIGQNRPNVVRIVLDLKGRVTPVGGRSATCMRAARRNGGAVIQWSFSMPDSYCGTGGGMYAGH